MHGGDGDTDVMNGMDEVAELDKRLKLLSKNQDSKIQMDSRALEEKQFVTEELKRENTEYKELIKQMHRELGFGGKTMQEREKENLETKVIQLRKDLDDCRFQLKSMQLAMKNRKDSLMDIQRESTPLLTDNSPLTQQIRILENRLDKAMIKFNEATSIKKTYESILKRLEEERLGFDNQLQAIEKTLKAKQSDFTELQGLCHDAKYLKESAKAALAKAMQEFEDLKNQKQKELEEKKKYVQARIEMTSSLSKREANRRRVELEHKGDMSEEGEEKLKAAAYAQTFQGLSNDSKLDIEQEKLGKLETVWRKLKEVTGANDANEVIQKFLSSNDTSKDLKNMTKEAQQKIDNLVWTKAQLKAKLEETKYSQSTGLGSRRIVDEFEQQLGEAKANVERNRLQYEKIAKILVDAKAGIEHLAEKLIDVPVDETEETEETEFDGARPSEQDNKALEFARTLRAKLSALVQELGPAAEPGYMTSKSIDVASSQELVRISDFNVRIRLDEEEDDDDDEYDEDDDPTVEPSTRERIKQIAANESNKHNKSNKKKKRAGGKTAA